MIKIKPVCFIKKWTKSNLENGFFDLVKTVFDGKTRIVGQKCLVHELVLSFYAIKKCAKAKSYLIILSKYINNNNDNNRKTDTDVKIIFSHSGDLKTSTFDRICEIHFSPKTNTFLLLMRM